MQQVKKVQGFLRYAGNPLGVLLMCTEARDCIRRGYFSGGHMAANSVRFEIRPAVIDVQSELCFAGHIVVVRNIALS